MTSALIFGLSPSALFAILCGLALAFVGLVLWLGRGTRPSAALARRRNTAAPLKPASSSATQLSPTKQPPPPTLLELKNIGRDYIDVGGALVHAVARANLRIREGEVLGIIGPSGQGKSTLLNICGGLDQPTSGTVLFEGRELAREEGEELRRYRAEQISFIFQDLNLVTHLGAAENAALPLLCRGMGRQAALAQAHSMLERLGIGELAHRRPNQLSGGQKQRVAIARAFCSPARLILADEPTGSLDPETAREVMDAFAELGREQGRTVVLVTHNTSLARRYCDRILQCTTKGLVEVVGRGRTEAEKQRPATDPRTEGARP